MEEPLGSRVWLPIVVTFAVWVALIFIIDALVAKMWADLIGLFYLMASPFIYRGLKSSVGDTAGDTEGNADQSRSTNAG